MVELIEFLRHAQWELNTQPTPGLVELMKKREPELNR